MSPMLKVAARLEPPALPRSVKAGLDAPEVKLSLLPLELLRVPLTTRPSVLKAFTWPRVRKPCEGLLIERERRMPGAFGLGAVVIALVWASSSTPLCPELKGLAPTHRLAMLAVKLLRPERSSVARDTCWTSIRLAGLFTTRLPAPAMVV